ncbi:peptide chain release factor N(5)-glutamine methyltransferase [Desulfonatronospira sp.]|uniref:peptide chain release factor N(5)-glutamine methyltransferase n=1 Tax=Desulfonatronospira sp. TaxID=1962951 RepID=UPI0025C28AAE|nr:peptide chain release factor N(5)-glutamine methyltransferase [Desulfonatronospira sp.]
MPIIASLLAGGTSDLIEAGVDSPGLSARLLMAHVLECSCERLVLILDQQAGKNIEKYFQRLISRRAGGEPVAYILGQKEFYSLDFKVSPGVLIPRPETEMLVELTGRWFPPKQEMVFADIGTGSGILGICIALKFPLFACLACDISMQALEIARANACKHGVSDRILFFKGDMGQGIMNQRLDFIVCNPPYVCADEFAALDKSVRCFEPALALLSPDQGLGHIKRLEAVAAQALRRGSPLFLEMGHWQADRIREIFSGWRNFQMFRDLAGLDRAAVIIK